MKNEECAGKMKNATENKEFDTMVRILKRNDLCTMVSDLPFKNGAVFCKIGHSAYPYTTLGIDQNYAAVCFSQCQ